MLTLFLRGGPLMWPLLLVSLVTVTLVIERVFFLVREARDRRPELAEAMLAALERGAEGEAVRIAGTSRDFIARTLIHALEHRDPPVSGALLRAASRELQRWSRGLAVLDTVITLAPLLGLLGTVTGMIRAFSLLGERELSAPVAITGGIAEALIATAFGLAIAITALIPFNYLNARLEAARLELEDAATRFEALLHENPVPREPPQGAH